MFDNPTASLQVACNGGSGLGAVLWRWTAKPDSKLQNKPDIRNKPPQNCAKPNDGRQWLIRSFYRMSCPDPMDRIKKTSSTAFMPDGFSWQAIAEACEAKRPGWLPFLSITQIYDIRSYTQRKPPIDNHGFGVIHFVL